MESATPYTQNMIRQYNKQILMTRRLAYHQHTRRMASGVEPEILPDVKRRMMVNRVAREVFTNLLAIGSDNPMVLEVRTTLQKEFGEELQFCYPPGSLDVVIYRKTPTGPVELSERERIDATSRAWELTLSIVDTYMA